MKMDSLHQWVKQHRLRNHPFVKDKDKDGVPCQLDCAPNDPTKQGKYFSVKYGGKEVKPFHSIKEKIKKWNEERPQREQARIESLQREAKAEEARLRIERAREKVRSLKEKTYQRYSPMMGIGGSHFMEPYKEPATKTYTKRNKTMCCIVER